MIAILMSTYNGSIYLKEQIESLIKQSFMDWVLYIRDDGSTDDTRDIIDFYCNKYDFIKKIDSCVENLGVTKSFLYLLKNVDADYYMFCDQDDIWLRDKVKRSYEVIKCHEKNYGGAVIAFSDLKVVDRDLNTVSESFFDLLGVNRFLNNSNYLYTGNYIPGCAMIFNKQAKKCALEDDYINYNTIHDYFLILKVLKHKGMIISINQPLMLYRQHGSNTIGAVYDKGSFISRILNLKDTIMNNWRRYRIVREVSGLSLCKYIYYKMFTIFLFTRS